MRTRSCTANMVCIRCAIPEVDATPLEAVEKAILLCQSICYLIRATSYEPCFSSPGDRHQLDHLSFSGSTQSGPLFKKRASSKYPTGLRVRTPSMMFFDSTPFARLLPPVCAVYPKASVCRHKQSGSCSGSPSFCCGQPMSRIQARSKHLSEPSCSI